MSEPTIQIDQKILKRILAAMVTAPNGVYSPREDSFLMLEAISAISVEKQKVLDLGTGSGILGLYCALRGADVTVTDIDETALHCANDSAQRLEVTIKTVKSDLFSEISEQFDIVLFNPPYLPSKTLEDRTVDGGKSGVTITERFLDALQAHLNKDGIALLLLSSQNEPTAIMARHPAFEASVMAKRPLFFEELQVLGLRFRENAAR